MFFSALRRTRMWEELAKELKKKSETKKDKSKSKIKEKKLHFIRDSKL